jgi:alpha-L-fucosidase
MGDWLNVNGEAIYATTTWENSDEAKMENVFYTKKGDDLYVICTSFPEKPFTIKGLQSTKVSMLGYDGKVVAKSRGGNVTITPPSVTPADNPCNYAWVFKVEDGI